MIDDQIKAFVKRSWDVLEEPTTQAWGGKRKLAQALRELNHLVVCSDAPAPELLEAAQRIDQALALLKPCLLYTSPSPRDRTRSRMPSSA